MGDSIVLTIDAVTKEYIISCSFETVSESGLKIMFMTDAVAECKNYTTSRAFVQLENIDDYDHFKKDVEDKFAGVSVDTDWFAMQNSVEFIQDMLESISLVLICYW